MSEDDEEVTSTEAEMLARAFAEMLATASLIGCDATKLELMGPFLADMTRSAIEDDGGIDITPVVAGCTIVVVELVDMIQDSEWRVGLADEPSRADIWAKVRRRLNEQLGDEPSRRG